MEMTRREFLEGLPKTALKLTIASQALSGLDSLVFGEEDYLSKLPPLNGRKVTEELIQEMLNVGSVRGILEKYGNKDNIFYVQFKPDGKNNLDELVRKDPEKWDGGYVLVSGNMTNNSSKYRRLDESLILIFLSLSKPKTKFIFYDVEKDPNVQYTPQHTKGKYITDTEQWFYKANIRSLPNVVLFANRGEIFDISGGLLIMDKKEKTLYGNFYNRKSWIEHYLEGLWQKDDNKRIRLKYDHGAKLKKEVIGDVE